MKVIILKNCYYFSLSLPRSTAEKSSFLFISNLRVYVIIYDVSWRSSFVYFFLFCILKKSDIFLLSFKLENKTYGYRHKKEIQYSKTVVSFELYFPPFFFKTIF